MGEKKFVFILGGVRSGKSRFALQMAKDLQSDNVVFVATAEAKDEEMKFRIEKHKTERPSEWKTIEAPKEVGKHIINYPHPITGVVIDCITILISNLFIDLKEPYSYEILKEKMENEYHGIINAYKMKNSPFFVVSNEVGMGIVPAYAMGRMYRDVLGEMNQKLASAADEIFFLVAGIPMKIK